MIDLKPEELRVTCLPHPASRGMSVPAMGSGVAIEHLPTGLFATAEEHRSQHRNREVALGRLETLVGVWNARHIDPATKAQIEADVLRRVADEWKSLDSCAATHSLIDSAYQLKREADRMLKEANQ